MAQLKNPRMLFAAGVAAVAVLVAVVLLTRDSSDSDATSASSATRTTSTPSTTSTTNTSTAADQPLRVVKAKLTLEAAVRPDTGARELVVSLAAPQLNRPEVTGGAASVELRCETAGGATALRRPVDWPLLEEAGYPPHTHQPAGKPVLDSIRSCRLTGPGIDFEGRVSGRVPLAE